MQVCLGWLTGWTGEVGGIRWDIEPKNWGERNQNEQREDRKMCLAGQTWIQMGDF